MNSVVGSFIGWGLLSYLLGAIPCGYLIGRLNGIDIRTVGSGNIGATNVFRSVGKSWGILTFLCDALKGFIPTWCFPALAAHYGSYHGGPALSVTCACLAIAGHNWPVYLRFKGGKGIAASLGAMIGITPAAAGWGLLCWVIVFTVTRYVSVASISAALGVGIAAWFLYLKTGILIPVALSLLGAVAIWRHKANIQRLWHGTEHRFQFGGKNENRNS